MPSFPYTNASDVGQIAAATENVAVSAAAGKARRGEGSAAGLLLAAFLG